MSEARWTRLAQADLARIDEWHSHRDLDFAARLGFEALAEARRAADAPGLGSPTDLRLRKWRVGKTGYLLFYREVDGQTEIVRMRHERENWTLS